MSRVAWLLLAGASLLAGCRNSGAPAHLHVADGDAERGRMVVGRIGCGVCHAIPNVKGARGRVGPSLEAFGSRAFIAGRMPNRPGTLVQFVRNAPSLEPGTAMPELPLDDQEARDVAAFLYTLR